MRDALVRSKNVPTVRLAQEVGTPRVAELAEDAGLEPPIPEQPSMALGTIAVSPIELTAAYTAFADLGERVTPRVVDEVDDAKGQPLWTADPPARSPVLDDSVAYVVTDVLREALARGTGQAVTPAGFHAPAAGKTGTTNDGADVWLRGLHAGGRGQRLDRIRPAPSHHGPGHRRPRGRARSRVMMRGCAGRPMPAPGRGRRASSKASSIRRPACSSPKAAAVGGDGLQRDLRPRSGPVTACPSQGEAWSIPWRCPRCPISRRGWRRGSAEDLPLETGPSAVESPLPEASAPPLSYAPSSPRPPSPSAELVASPRPAASVSPSSTPPPAAEEPPEVEPSPIPGPSPETR